MRDARPKKKTGQYQHTCRDRRGAGRGRVDLIHEDGTKGDPQQDQDDTAFHYGSSVGWVNDPNDEVHGWDSDSSTDFIVMSTKRRKEEELKVAGAKLALKIKGNSTQAWIDSGVPISIFTIGNKNLL